MDGANEAIGQGCAAIRGGFVDEDMPTLVEKKQERGGNPFFE